MSASVREQILARLQALLLAAATPAGSNVFRSREVGLPIRETPAIVIRPDGEDDEPFGDRNDRHVLEVELVFVVRGDPWDSLADAIAVPAHAAVVADPVLLDLVGDVIRKTGSQWVAEEADHTAGALITRYRFQYLTSIRDITVALTS